MNVLNLPCQRSEPSPYLVHRLKHVPASLMFRSLLPAASVLSLNVMPYALWRVLERHLCVASSLSCAAVLSQGASQGDFHEQGQAAAPGEQGRDLKYSPICKQKSPDNKLVQGFSLAFNYHPAQLPPAPPHPPSSPLPLSTHAAPPYPSSPTHPSHLQSTPEVASCAILMT